MTKSIRSFDRMNIPAPCDADWDSMIGNDEVRFCEHCRLHVTNVSALTRQAAMRLVAQSEGRLCVRFARRPDGGIATKELSRPLYQIGRRVSRITAGAFTAALSLSAATAQTGSAQERAVTIAVAAPSNLPASGAGSILSGVVSDPQGAVILGATVTLTDTKNGLTYSYHTADDGLYKFSQLPATSYRLSVEASGFQSLLQDLSLAVGVERSFNVELTLPELSAEVEVKSDPVEVQNAIGGVVVFREPEEPLVKAAFRNDLNAVRELVFSALDINVRDQNTNVTALEQAVENGNVEMVRTLLAAGASANSGNRTSLMYLDEDATPELVRELVSAGAKVNAQDESGGTALMNAADRCKYEVFKELLDLGARLDLKDADGRTALMFAATNDDPRLVKDLIDQGADVNATDNHGRNALMLAAELGEPEVVKLLISFNANVNAVDDDGFTALMYVAGTSDVESALALLNAGADVTPKNNEGKTALALGRQYTNPEMQKLLVSRGAPE